jgi:hypothetical protein
MNKRNVALIFFVLPLISLIAFQGKSLGTHPIVVTKSKVTGAHADLDCTTCHVDAHKPEIDVTICSTCHADTWSMVQAGEHEGGSAPFERYCVTCHDPHHPEYLWNLTKDDWILLDATAPEINALCYQCHTFSPQEFNLITDSHDPSKVTKPLVPTTLVFVLTVTASLVITLVTAIAITKSAKIKPKPSQALPR